MNQIISIKGKKLGEGKPLVCVPVMAAAKSEIIKQVRQLSEKNTEMIEWRLDVFENIDSMNAIREVLAELAPVIGNSIFVYTYRSKGQGGMGTLSEEKVLDIHQIGAESGVVDFVDVEYFMSKNPKREIHQLQQTGVNIIASHHDFEQTPEQNVIRMLLEKMAESGTDIVKLAVMPQNISDVLLLLKETAEFHQIYPMQPLITMSMGRLGIISRISGEIFGSCVTFGSGELASAPGQLPQNEVEQILEILHKQ